MWRDDSVSPTPSVGMQMQATAGVFEYAGNLNSIKFISVSATTVLGASFYKIEGS